MKYLNQFTYNKVELNTTKQKSSKKKNTHTNAVTQDRTRVQTLQIAESKSKTTQDGLI